MIEKCRDILIIFFCGSNINRPFCCIPHELLIVQLSVYGLCSDYFCYTYSYLNDSIQCVRINNKQSNFDTTKSGVPQSSILFNIFFNDFLFFFPKVSLHNFADNNTLCRFASYNGLCSNKMIAVLHRTFS